MRFTGYLISLLRGTLVRRARRATGRTAPIFVTVVEAKVVLLYFPSCLRPLL